LVFSDRDVGKKNRRDHRSIRMWRVPKQVSLVDTGFRGGKDDRPAIRRRAKAARNFKRRAQFGYFDTSTFLK
jgi:hypothetical protein